jgi:hydroxymethylbilane synthase
LKRLRIGTRGSALALWQANHIADKLSKLQGVETEIIRIRSTGDRLQSASVSAIGAELGTKGIFVKELEDALLVGTVDLAVHSMKDVPTEVPEGLTFAAITAREDPRDCLICRAKCTLETLPAGARVGTSSLRRQAQLRRRRPDLDVRDLRGNVDTRLKKLDSGEFDAIALAVAGVSRLGLKDRISQILDEDVMLPAVGQGALGIETRASDRETGEIVTSLDDLETRACVTAERALLHELQGGCQIPLGAWGRVLAGTLRLEAAVFSVDGSESVRFDEAGDIDDAAGLGSHLGHSMIEAGADRILRLAGRTVSGQS